LVPTYEYRCKACGTELEVVQSFTDDALTTCTACGGDLRKVFGAVGIAFKGSGFYKTDSRSGSKSSTSSSGDGAGSSSDAGSSSSSSDSSPSTPDSKKSDAKKPDATKKTDTSKKTAAAS
jgi:putative FmdB family regulatory protein